MADSVRLIIEIDDQASPVIQQFASRTERLLQRTQASITRGNQQIIQSQQQFRTSTLSLSTTLRGLYALLAAGAVARFAAEAVQASNQIKALETAFKTITGSATGAQKELAFLRAESHRLGIDFVSSAQAFQGFAAAARNTTLEGEGAREVFTAVAEASRVLSLTTEQTQGALTALQQIMSKGTVQAEELRGQLGERIPGAFQIAARAMGVTTAALGDMLQQGQVLSSDFLPRFARQLRQEFAGGISEASRTFQAETTRMNNAWRELLATLGQIITESPTIINAIRSITRSIESLAAGVEAALPAIEREIQNTFTGMERFLHGSGAAVGEFATKVADLTAEIASVDRQIAHLIEQSQNANFLERLLLFGFSSPDAAIQHLRDMRTELERLRAEALAQAGPIPVPAPGTRLTLGEEISPVSPLASFPFKEEAELAKTSLATIRAEMERIERLRKLGLSDLEALTQQEQLLEKTVNDVLIALSKKPGAIQALPPEVRAIVEEETRLLAVSRSNLDALKDRLASERELRREMSDEEFAERTVANIRDRVEAQQRANDEILDEQHQTQQQFIEIAQRTREAVENEEAAYTQAVIDHVKQRLAAREEEAEATQRAFERIRERAIREQERELDRQEQNYQRFRDRLEDDFADTLRNLPELAKDPLDALLALFQDFAARALASMLTDLIDPLLRQLQGIPAAVSQTTVGAINPAAIPLIQPPGTPRGGQTGAQQAGAAIATGAGAPRGGVIGGVQAGTLTTGQAIAGVAGGAAAGVGTALVVNQLGQQLGLGGPGSGALAGAAGGAVLGTAILPGIGTVVGAALGAFVGAVAGGLFSGGAPRTRITPVTTGAARPGAFEDRFFRETPFGFVGLSAERDLTRRTSVEATRAFVNFIADVDHQIASLLDDRQEQLAAAALQRAPGLTQRFRDIDGEMQELLINRMSTILRGFGVQDRTAPGVGANVSGPLQQVFGDFLEDLDEIDPQQIVQRFTEVVGLLNTIEEVSRPAGSVTQAEQAITALNQQFDQLIFQAQQLGIAVGDLETVRQRRLTELTEGFTESIQDQILAITDPQALALVQLERQQEERVREAIALGASLVDVERLYALERERILRDSTQRQLQDLSGLRTFLLGITAGPQSPLPTQERLQLAEAEFARQREAAFAGQLDQAALQQAAQNLLAVSQQAFASSGAFFERFEFIRRTLETILAREDNQSTTALNMIEESSANTAQNTYQLLQEIRALRAQNERMEREITRLNAARVAGAG